MSGARKPKREQPKPSEAVPDADHPLLRRRWYHLRWLDIAGVLGLAMVVPQIVDRYTTGKPSDPVLAALGTGLVAAVSGGPRVLDAFAARALRRSGRAE